MNKELQEMWEEACVDRSKAPRPLLGQSLSDQDLNSGHPEHEGQMLLTWLQFLLVQE